MRGNPYPGPQAFDAELANLFYGRRKELRILAGLAEARRASLLFSASGAGKSSLINAGLLPTLTETRATGRGSRRRAFQRMYLVGSASVGGEPRGVAPDNTYVYLALQSLRPNGASQELARQRLAEGLEPRMRQEHGTPGLLILDQFEELFTRNVDCWRERTAFIEQLQEALDRHPDLHVLFSMREEFIAELTPFAGLLPERLQARFRLERLRREAALEAVTRPAAEAGCPFADEEVAGELVDNLLGDGAPSAAGEFVEPVHLQIVCRQLWQRLAEGSTEIRREHLISYADVDEALRSYYQAGLDGVLAVPGGRVRENALRDWFDRSNLITPSRTCGLVLRGDETTGGLANEAVDRLENAYLIRRIRRGSDTWFELAHDRLVEPILADNAEWRREHLKPVTVAAEKWGEADEDPRRLWSGAELKVVAAEAKADPGAYSELERRFVERSVTRRRKRVGSAIGAVLGLLLVLGMVTCSQREAVRQRELAKAQQYLSDLRLARAQLEQGEVVKAAETLWRTPEDRRNWEWGYLLGKSYAREVGMTDDQLVDAAYSPAPDRPWIATAADSSGSVRLWDPAKDAERMSLPAVCKTEEGSEGVLSEVRFSGDGRRLLTFCKAPTAGGADPRARVWSTEAEGPYLAEVVWEIPRPVAFDFAGSRALARGREEGVEIWNWDADERENGRGVLTSRGVSSAAFCGGVEWVVTGSAEGKVELWDLATGTARAAPEGHQERVVALACSPDGGRLISGSEDGTARVWSVTPRGAVPLVPLEPRDGLKHDSVVEHVAFADGGRPLTVTKDGLRLWDLADPSASKQAAAPDGSSLERAVFSPDGQRVLARGRGAALLWNWQSRETPRQFKAPQKDIAVRAAFSPDGSRVLTMSRRDRAVRIWEADGRDLSWPFEERIVAARAAGDGVRVVTRGPRLLSRGAGSGESEGLPLAGHERKIDAAAFSADGRKLVTASRDAVRVWVAAETGADDWQPAPFPALTTVGRVGWTAFSPDGSRFAAASGSTVSVWDASTGEEVVTIPRDDGPAPDDPQLDHGQITHFSFGPRGRRLVTASAAGTATIWDAATGAELKRLAGHAGDRVAFAAFSPDGRLVVTAGEDQAARLWEAESGDPVSGVGGEPWVVSHEDDVVWADFSPDGTRIFTAGRDGTARIWNLDGEELARIDADEDVASARFVAASRRLLVVSNKGRRADLLAVFPFRLDQLPRLPGDRAASWEERFAQFEVEIW